MRYLLIIFTILLFIPLVSAESFSIQTSTDKLELNESLGSVVGSFGAAKLSMLKDGEVQTKLGSSSFKQYIRFSSSEAAIPGLRVAFTENNKGTFGAYLTAVEGQNASNALFEYEVDFGAGLKSSVDASVLSSLTKNTITLLGQQFMFLKSSVDVASGSINLKLAYADQQVQVKEGSIQQVNLSGKVYTLEATSIATAVTLKINNKSITLKEGETKDVDNVLFALADVVQDANASNDAVLMLVNASVLTFKDAKVSDEEFVQGFLYNNQVLSSVWVKVKASLTATEATITKLQMRVAPLGKSSGDIAVAQNAGLRSVIKHPNALLVPTWDIIFKGLTAPEKSKIQFIPAAGHGYSLSFTNKDGKLYKVPFVSNDGVFKLGDTHDFFIVEGSSSSDFLVDQNDYFLVTTVNDKTGMSNIVKYDSIDVNDQVVYFEDLSTGDFSAAFTLSSSNYSGEGSFLLAGKAHKFYIENITTGANASTLAIDLNGDGDVAGDVMNVVVKGGGILNLGSTNVPVGSISVTLTTDASQFDESSSSEVLTIPIEASTNAVGIANLSGLALDARGKRTEGVSSFGVAVNMLNEDTESLTLEYPVSQVFGQVEVVYTPSTQFFSASCSDGLQNQQELGVDCGGPCAICVVANVTNNTVVNVTLVTNVTLEVCEGCLRDGTCYGVGTRLGEQFCAADQVIRFLKEKGKPCSRDFECQENLCKEDVCYAVAKSIDPVLVILNIAVLLGIIVFLIFTFHKERNPPVVPPQA
ncbi:MAG: hypothetical protein Q7R96_04175 [Nanoarchaeota archaeon]|nr:hypothetical protein [Nanoarchaeota archaeon]